MWNTLTDWLQTAFFPAQCLGCNSMGLYLCPSCRSTMVASREMVGGFPLFTLGSYEGALRQALTQVKSRGHRAGGRELARLGVEAWLPQLAGIVTLPKLHPIAPSVAGQKFRGFSLPMMLARELQRNTGWPLLESSLAGTFPREERPSQGMGASERWGRRRLGSQAVPSVPGPPMGSLILLDDVVTTGATLSATAARARELGFDSVVSLALAVVPSE